MNRHTQANIPDSSSEVRAPELPAGAEIHHVAFVTPSSGNSGGEPLVSFPAPFHRQAVLLDAGAAAAVPRPGPGAATGVSILSIPTVEPESPDQQLAARAWVEMGSVASSRSCLLISLQGAQIFWSPERIAILVPASRLERARTAIIETSFYEAELRALENWLGAGWEQLELDAPQAFEFRESALAKRQDLARRFQAVIGMRARFARLLPQVHCPSLYPPTLASQIAERLRERTRMVERMETAGSQLEVFERVYELCGHRTSEYLHSRSSNTLEWVIIILLLAQTIMLVVEFLSAAGS